MASSAAPGDLEIVRDFVNTIEMEGAADPLGDGDSLPQWCEQTGLCPQPDAAALRRLREFREGLRAVLEANAGEGRPAERWQALEPFVGAAGYKMYVTAAGRPALAPEGSGAEAAIATLL